MALDVHIALSCSQIGPAMHLSFVIPLLFSTGSDYFASIEIKHLHAMWRRPLHPPPEHPIDLCTGASSSSSSVWKDPLHTAKRKHAEMHQPPDATVQPSIPDPLTRPFREIMKDTFLCNALSAKSVAEMIRAHTVSGTTDCRDLSGAGHKGKQAGNLSRDLMRIFLAETDMPELLWCGIPVWHPKEELKLVIDFPFATS
jgi:hypothetical protein